MSELHCIKCGGQSLEQISKKDMAHVLARLKVDVVGWHCLICNLRFCFKVIEAHS